MQNQDIDPVTAIDRASFSMPWPASAYRYELNENPRSLLWVAEINNNNGESFPVGMIVVWMILDEAHIATIAVNPEFRGRGIAKSMLVIALREAIRHGATSATLEVRASNIAAQNLYHQFQFQVAGYRPRYYRDNNEEALIMTASNLNQSYLAWLDQEGWRNHSSELSGGDY